MALPRAARWPPPLLLLLLLLLPAPPGTRGQPPPLARRAPSRAPLAGTPLARPPEPGPERELQPPPKPPRERRGPAPPDPSQLAPAPGAATRRGPSGRVPRGRSAAAMRGHWPESNSEPHVENITFDQNQVDFSTVTSKEVVLVQTFGKNHASSDATENFSLQTETANAEGRNDFSRRTNFTISLEGPEIATVLTSQSSTLALGRPRLPSSSSGSEGRTIPSQEESRTPQGTLVRGMGLPEEATSHTHVAATSVVSQSSAPALEMGEETTVSRKSNSLRTERSWAYFSRTSSPDSDHVSSSRIMEEFNTTALQGSSIRQTVGVHVATAFPDGVPETVSMEPLNKTETFPEDFRIATASASVHSSPSEAELRRNSGAIGNMEGGKFIEQSTENAFGLTSSEVSVGFWQNDSPTSGGRQLVSSSDVASRSGASQTEAVSRPIPSVRGGERTAPWFLTESETFTDVTGSSTSYPEVVNASVLTQFSASAPQSRGSDTTLHERNYSEPSARFLSSSSSESLDFSAAPRATEDGPKLGASSDVEERTPKGTSGARALGTHTSATFTGSGERMLRSLTNGSTTSRGEGRSAADPETESATHGDTTVTGDAHLVSGSLPVSQVLGVTGVSSDQVSGTDIEQRTSSDLTDHTYVSSTFTKGERALLSITDNSSSSDMRESSTSVQISNFSQSDHSSSSLVHVGREKVSPDVGEYAQPSTESLVVRTAHPPSYTPTVHVEDTWVLLDADAGPVGNSSSSGSLLPLPSVSQSYQPFSSLSSTRATTHPQQSTPRTPPPLSSSPPPSPVSMTTSTSVSISQTTSPLSLSTVILPRARDTPVTSVRVSTVASSVAMLPSSQTTGSTNQSGSHHEKIMTDSKLPNPVSLPTEATKAVTVSSTSGIPLPPALTEFSPEHTLPVTSTSSAQTYPSLTTSAPKTSPSPGPTASPPSSIAAPTAGPTTVQATSGKPPVPTSPEILVSRSSREGATTTRGDPEHLDATTQLVPLISIPTTARDVTTGLGTGDEYSPASHFLRTSPSQTTDVSMPEMSPPRSQSSTQSPVALSSPASDVNECLLSPCPPLAMCNNTQGSFTCKCPVGYQLEKGICNLVRTFMTELKLKKSFLNTTMEKHSDLHEFESEITKMLNMCFSKLPGYTRSTVHASRESSAAVMSLQTTFSLASNVTLFDLADKMQKCVNSCRSSAEVCQLLGSQRRIFRAGSLCKRKTPECDKETSICTDLDGVARCQCKLGYFQFNKMDHSCRACEDGYRLENETCMSCPFGLGGLNCGNPYQLITVVIAAAGGGLLLILGIALIVTCCRKNKNDISKLIFKSGDFQMSPYAEYPKNPRSQEWGREAIEMHENGSTKNLLQMTDVYYSPTSVRNPELERNGLYPAYTGLPGSRHSCIFPGQYNPSFISDESRRRDYF
ncbi:protein HEG homolog 1 isoform X2 [Talpa occidentalis]|uniref:protein HEG homolog 1 isoform X2 n=1 Tax=Talpa occidentalis TaxID=50954 RepID=UPI0023F6C6DB|nr:protein HEG homolog 1 isoform X2 [Talpa occidentalis]